MARAGQRLALALALTAASWAALAWPAVANHRFDVVDETPKVSTIVYLAVSPHGVYQWWAATTDGERRRRIASADIFNRAPGWTPCCRKIKLLFPNFRGSVRPLELEIDGTDRRSFAGKLSNELLSGPDISQRSGRVVFGERDELSIMYPDGSIKVIRKFAQNEGLGSVAISPTGTSVAFGYAQNGGSFQIRVIDGDGSNERAIYESPDDVGGNPAFDSNFDFTAQGGRLVFGESRALCDECPSDFDESVNLYIANTLGFGASRIASTPQINEHFPLFNPSASHIAYVPDHFSDGSGGDLRNEPLQIMGIGGGGVRTLVKDRAGWTYQPLLWVKAKWQKRRNIKH